MSTSRYSEAERLATLRATGLLDSPPSEEFDRITRLVCKTFDAPMAIIGFIDADRQWFKSEIGMGVRETCREDAFCNHTIRQQSVMVVEDSLRDSRFVNNPLVTGAPHIRFYAGAPLRLLNGHILGALCVLDHRPRSFDAHQIRQLEDFAALAVAQINLQCSFARLDEATLLPNRNQLLADLAGLCVSEPGGERTLALVELMSTEVLMDVRRAVGTDSIERLYHQAGRQIALWVGDTTRVYRTDSSHLALVLKGSSVTETRAFAETLLSSLDHALMNLSDGRHPVIHQRRRIGLVPLKLEPADAGDALRRASVALFHASGTIDDITVYDAAADVRHQHAYELLARVPRALDSGEFRLVYQPQFERASMQYTSVEALLRWDHPVLGPVSPGEFIPLLEKTTYIQPVTHWVIDTALAQIRAWEAEDVRVNVAVNVSPRNLEHPGFMDQLLASCERHGLAPSRLEIECTENAVLTEGPTLDAVRALRALGVRVALDDFGTGYCNFGCLYGLPAEVLKLDQSLIRPIGTDARALDVVRAMVQLGHTLGYRLLAEGVETAEVFDQLLQIGCDQAQGYYLSRPQPPAEAFDFLRRWNGLMAPT